MYIPYAFLVRQTCTCQHKAIIWASAMTCTMLQVLEFTWMNSKRLVSEQHHSPHGVLANEICGPDTH